MKSPKTNLVIVESPAKTKSIQKYLGDEFTVISSKGHIVDLPKSKLGIDVENNFTPLYENMAGKSKVIKELVTQAKKAKTIYLATDLDREGEAIAWHITSVLGGLNKVGKVDPENISHYQRVVFSEITKDAILKAFETPRGFNFDLVDAYQARRVLDRLVGYKLSPLLWKKIQYGLSAGRVQSVALRLIVEREKERNSFNKTAYYRIYARLGNNSNEIKAELIQIDKKAIETKQTLDLFAGPYSYSSTSINDESKLNSLLTDLSAVHTLTVDNIEQKIIQKSAPSPFTTASLQRTASTRLHISPKQTMRLAQQLYEQGYITYHRTDSTNLSVDFVKSLREYIQKSFGEKYLPPSVKIYASKQKNAQEAHEAIRPTQIGDDKKLLGEIATNVSEEARELFQLISNRTIACQMESAQFNTQKITFIPTEQTNRQYLFSSSGSVILFDGFMRVWNGEETEQELPILKENQQIMVSKIESSSHETTPPPRYSEASLIKEMETHGIGRPSTYAPTIGTIESRNYTLMQNGYLVPTDIGNAVSNLLSDHFTNIVDLNFTAEMEEKLDIVAEGKIAWQKIIGDFYTPFEKELTSKDQSLERKDYKILEQLEEKCPDCAHNLVLKLGKYGKFYSCSNFPECKYAKPFVETIGLKCPDCKDGDIITRRTKRGKIFYGCSKYPDCKYASWDDPRKTKTEIGVPSSNQE